MTRENKETKELVNFLISIGNLKDKKRKGWVLRNVKNPETIAAHTFRMAIMAWIIGKKKKMNIDKVLKMSLIHDICEVYTGDITPYDKILPKDKKKQKKVLEKWPRFSKKAKQINFREKYKKEKKALKKIISKLSPNLKKEIKNLWEDYEKGETREGRFVKQLDRLENLLQALEYWKRGEKFMIEPWWIQIKELIDDPDLLDFMQILEEKFHKEKK